MENHTGMPNSGFIPAGSLDPLEAPSGDGADTHGNPDGNLKNRIETRTRHCDCPAHPLRGRWETPLERALTPIPVMGNDVAIIIDDYTLRGNSLIGKSFISRVEVYDLTRMCMRFL
jgi:hypothetical protein